MPTAPDTCPTCGAPVTVVAINLQEEVVTMRSCNRCDRRWWKTADGADVEPTSLFAIRGT